MATLLEQLLNAANRGQSALNQWLEQHARELTPELAAEARQVYKQAIGAQRMQSALTAIQAASLVYLRCGQRYEALSNYLDYYQILFVGANTVDEYQFVREGSLDILSLAEEIKAEDLAFQAAELAADCAFFAAQSTQEKDTKAQWLLTALTDLVAASEKGKYYVDTGWFQKFVSLLAATVQETMSRYWSDKEEDEVNTQLRQLAAAAETLIPVEFEFSADASKTNGIARALAQLSYGYGNPAVASARLYTAIRRAEETGDIETWIQTVYERYVGARESGTPSAQLMDLRHSLLSRVEQLRLQFRSRAGRLWAAQELEYIFGEFMRDERREGRLNESELFAAVDMAKARTLLDQIGVSIRSFPTAELDLQAAEMERQMLRFEPEASEDSETPLRSEMRLVSQLSIGSTFDREERRKLLASIESLYATHAAGFEGVESVVSLSQVMSALQSDEALIEYYYPYHPLHPAIELFILAVTSKQAQVIPVSLETLPGREFIGRMSVDRREFLDISPLGNIVITLRTAIQKLDEAAGLESLEQLYPILISPLLERGLKPQDFTRWIIVPHGMLHNVPFAALIDSQGRHLIEDVALTVAPSASVWLKVQGRGAQPVKSFLGLANPVLSNMPPLPQAEVELASISQYLAALQNTVHTGRNATESALRDSVPSKGILHLATHGDFPEADAIDFHRILLSPTAQHDGRVTAEELRRMDLRSARLVVLSICNGGVYRFGPGDELYGLIPALLTAGAENVVGTLWPIEDRIGRAFMVEFYKYLLQHGPAEALRRVCLQSIQDLKLFRDWAGFVLVGPGRPLN